MHFAERRHHVECAGRFGGRHHHRHGRSGGDFDEEAFGGRRRMSADELQLVVLFMLNEKPRHGYELIKDLGEYTKGFYRPSPGVIYPVLTYLEESDLASVVAEGNKKRYEMTDAGRHYLEDNREQAENIMAGLQQMGERMNAMREAYAEVREEGKHPLHEAMHRLKKVLKPLRSASKEEAARIIAILDKAVDEIENP